VVGGVGEINRYNNDGGETEKMTAWSVFIRKTMRCLLNSAFVKHGVEADVNKCTVHNEIHS